LDVLENAEDMKLIILVFTLLSFGFTTQLKALTADEAWTITQPNKVTDCRVSLVGAFVKITEAAKLGKCSTIINVTDSKIAESLSSMLKSKGFETVYFSASGNLYILWGDCQ
jgi:hypothetical protein